MERQLSFEEISKLVEKVEEWHILGYDSEFIDGYISYLQLTVSGEGRRRFWKTNEYIGRIKIINGRYGEGGMVVSHLGGYEGGLIYKQMRENYRSKCREEQEKEEKRRVDAVSSLKVRISTKVETPKVEIPKLETPKIEMPRVETPSIETKFINPWEIEIPKYEGKK